MSTEQIIAEIEWLEHLFRLPDYRTFQIVYGAEKKQTDNRIVISNRSPRLPRRDWLEALLKLPDNRPFQP
jgi:hypothetical protein